jgi:hypothetical protein
MTFVNRNINFFCATTEPDDPGILKGGFRPIKTCDVNLCFLRSNLILCIRLSKNLQLYTGKRGDFKFQKIEQKYKELRLQFNEF